MNATNCKSVRYEIEEADLNEQLSETATLHLKSCPVCRSFYDERHRLRSLIASLETVGAPADFDFRLRARLARESDRTGGFAFGNLPISARVFAAAALCLLIVVGGIIIRNRTSPGNDSAANGTAPKVAVFQKELKAGVPTTSPDSGRVAKAPKSDGEIVKGTPPAERWTNNRPERVAGQMARAAAQNKSAVREESLVPSSVVVPKHPTDAVLVSADAPSFRISIGNGRGSARTISLPRFSFGSQRALAPGFSFAESSLSKKGAW